MLAALRRFVTEFSAAGRDAAVGPDEIQLAAASLLFHTVAVDGAVAESERMLLADLLARHFELGKADADELVEAARQAEAEASDLYGFTSLLKRRLSLADRERIVAIMWKLVYADGVVHEFEDNVVWRAAELLGVSSERRIALKRQARGDDA